MSKFSLARGMSGQKTERDRSTSGGHYRLVKLLLTTKQPVSWRWSSSWPTTRNSRDLAPFYHQTKQPDQSPAREFYARSLIAEKAVDSRV